VRLVGESTPFWQVVRALLFDVGLSVYAVLSSKLLRDWILDFDALDSLAEIGKGLTPGARVSKEIRIA
jgi:hypothetical protein